MTKTAAKVVKTPLIRVAVYTRQSVDRSTDADFGSLEAQREAIEAYIKSQSLNGWIALPDRYDDAGYSGSNIERPAFKRLLEDVKNGKVDVIACYKIDRLSRSLLDFAEIIAVLEKYGVTFISVTQSFNSTTPTGALTLNILMSFAQFEREQISERTRDKIRATRQRGLWCGGHPFLGYDLCDGKLVVNAAEAGMVNEIFELYIKLGSISAVADETTRRGWRNKVHTTKAGRVMRGLPFDQNAINRILRSPLYNGRVPYKKETFPGVHAAIIDDKLWRAVQHQLTTNKTRSGADQRNKYAALLRGLICCGRCGAKMKTTYNVRGARSYHYYVCRTLTEPTPDRCTNHRVRADDIEKFVVERIREFARDPRVVAETITAVRAAHVAQRPEIQAEVARIAQRRQKIADERRNLIRAISVSPDAVDALTPQLVTLDQETEKLDARDAELRHQLVGIDTYDVKADDVQTALHRFDPIWDRLTLRERTRLLSLLIERIAFYAAEGEVRITFRSGGIKVLAAEGAT